MKKKIELVLELSRISHEGAFNLENKETDTQALVYENDDSVYICYQASQGVLFQGSEDWDRNISFSKINVTIGKFTGKVHKAWWEAYSSLKEEIENIVKTKNKKIVFNGHSLGGALALISYVDFKDKYKDKIDDIILTGTPRPFSLALAKAIDKEYKNNITMVYNDLDIVGDLPFWFLNFGTVGKKVLIGNQWNVLGLVQGWETNSHTHTSYIKSLENFKD